MASGIGDRCEEWRHSRQNDGAGRGHDHKRDGAEERFPEMLAEQERNRKDNERCDDDAEGIPLLDLLDEERSHRSRFRGRGDKRHHARDHGLTRRTRDSHGQSPCAVDSSGEHTLAGFPTYGNGLARHRCLIHFAHAVDDDTIAPDALSGTDDDVITDPEIGGIDRLDRFDVIIGARSDESGGSLWRECKKAGHRVCGPLGDERFDRSAGGEDDDEECSIEDLADGCRRYCRDDHQQVDVQDLTAQRGDAGPRRLPSPGNVAG